MNETVFRKEAIERVMGAEGLNVFGSRIFGSRSSYMIYLIRA